MADPVADTLAWYSMHAEDFATQTARSDLRPFHDRFLRHVKLNGRILDAGCGVGRDTVAFADRGYEVVAFDASEELVSLARGHVGPRATVHQMRFEDVAWKGEFDGIWACASLLHVPLASFIREARPPGSRSPTVDTTLQIRISLCGNIGRFASRRLSCATLLTIGYLRRGKGRWLAGATIEAWTSRRSANAIFAQSSSRQPFVRPGGTRCCRSVKK